METEKCPGCGRSVKWVLWRRERWTEQWEPVAEGTEDEMKRQFASVPLTEDRYVYAYIKPCEAWPPQVRGVVASVERGRGYIQRTYGGQREPFSYEQGGVIGG